MITKTANLAFLPGVVRRIGGHVSRHELLTAAAGVSEGKPVINSLLIGPKQWLVMGIHIGTSKTKSEMYLRVVQCCFVISLKGFKYLPYLNDKPGVEAAAVGFQYLLIKQMNQSIDTSSPLYISLAKNPYFKWADLAMPELGDSYDGSGCFINPYEFRGNKYIIAKGLVIILINGILYLFLLIVTGKGGL